MFNNPAIVTADIQAVSDISVANADVFITNAVLIVTEELVDKGLSDERLRLIAIYLSAHFTFLKEGQVKSEKIGDSSTTYNVQSGEGLASTTHGQMVIQLDTTGTLASMANPDKSGEPQIISC